MADEATDRPRPGGRRADVGTGLRTAAVWAVVSDVAARRAADLGRPLRVVDLGGGTGGLAVPLAAAGHDVTVVDPSPDALASLRRRAEESGVSDRVTAVQGDADHLGDAVATVLGARPVDLVCCHGILEVVDDPDVAVAAIAGVLAPGGVVSVVAAQRLAAVLAHAVAGRFERARALLDDPGGRWGSGDPLARRFDRDELVETLQAHDLAVTDAHGVRVVTDLVPSAYVDSEADRVALLALEDAMATHPDAAVLGRIGTAVHVLATRT